MIYSLGAWPSWGELGREDAVEPHQRTRGQWAASCCCSQAPGRHHAHANWEGRTLVAWCHSPGLRETCRVSPVTGCVTHILTALHPLYLASGGCLGLNLSIPRPPSGYSLTPNHARERIGCAHPCPDSGCVLIQAQWMFLGRAGHCALFRGNQPLDSPLAG